MNIENKQHLGFHSLIRGVILSGFALLFISLLITDQINKYIAPRMMPLFYFSLVIIVLLSILQVYRSTSKGQQEEVDCNCGVVHSSSNSGWKSLFYGVFLLPVIVGYLIPVHSFGSSVIAKRGVQLSISSDSTQEPIVSKSLALATLPSNTGEKTQKIVDKAPIEQAKIESSVTNNVSTKLKTVTPIVKNSDPNKANLKVVNTNVHSNTVTKPVNQTPLQKEQVSNTKPVTSNSNTKSTTDKKNGDKQSGTSTGDSNNQTKPSDGTTSKNNTPTNTTTPAPPKGDVHFDNAQLGDHLNQIAQQLYNSNVITINEKNYVDALKIFTTYVDQFYGKKVVASGFVYHGGDFEQGEFILARFAVTCCTADARAYGYVIDGNDIYQDDTWIQIVGTIGKKKMGSRFVPIFNADSMSKISAPDNPYVYPTY